MTGGRREALWSCYKKDVQHLVAEGGWGCPAVTTELWHPVGMMERFGLGS